MAEQLDDLEKLAAMVKRSAGSVAKRQRQIERAKEAAKRKRHKHAAAPDLLDAGGAA